MYCFPYTELHITYDRFSLIIGETPALLTDSRKDMCKLSEEVHSFAFDIVFAQLKGYLTNLHAMEVTRFFVPYCVVLPNNSNF